MAAMDRIDLEATLSGFQERMSKVALFDPLFELQRKKQTDANGQPVEMMELGLLTLLFFFEQKLMRNTRVGVRELAQYLHAVIVDKLQIDLLQCEQLARDIIQVFRPSSGKKRAFSYYNWESGQQQIIHTSILRANAFDAKQNLQFYALDEDGLELVFATKEFYSEFQLSIHQLVLRKQLEKGEFQSALRQINEMRVDVEALRERIAKLGHEIKRSIVSEETLKRYSDLLEDIYLRLQRENVEFDELRQFVRETMMRLYGDLTLEKQANAYSFILRISSELEKVHGEHDGLLQQCMSLKNQALSAARESLYYTGLNAFNFEQDVAGKVFGTPLPLEAMKGIIAPFTGLEQKKNWSLLTLFSEQSLFGKGEQEPREEGFLTADEGVGKMDFVIRRGGFFQRIMALVITEMDRLQEMDLQYFVRQLDRHGVSDWLEKRSFYDFWLILHQRSPLRANMGDQVIDENVGLDDIWKLLEHRTLIVSECNGMVKGGMRYGIQNMTLKWGE